MKIWGRGGDSFTGGSGQDRFFGEGGSDTVYLGAGDYGDGGAGNDEFFISGAFGNAAGPIVDGGADSDTITFGAFTGSATFTLGAGQDTLAFSGYTPGAALVVTDFLAGDGGDRLSWTPFLQGWLSGWNGTSDLFAAGYLILVQRGPTGFWLDRDGAAARDFATFLTFRTSLRRLPLNFDGIPREPA